MHRNRLARLAITLALVSAAALPTLATAQTTRTSIPRYNHIFVIMMENHGYSEIIGNANAPHINALASKYGLATNYFGVTHPSEPNYVAVIGGSYFGIQDDAPYYTHTISAPSVADQLEAVGLTWKSYQESMPTPGFLGTVYPSKANALYAAKHNPFMNFAHVQSSVTELHKNVPIHFLFDDLANGTVPNFSFIAPDQCSDMHGGPPACPFSNTPGDTNDEALIKAGDDYVGGLYRRITTSTTWSQGRNAIVIVWDEDDFVANPAPGCCDANPGGGQVAAIVVTNHGPRGVQDATAYNHFSLLRTIQDAFGLGCLQFTCDSTNVVPMAPLFASS